MRWLKNLFGFGSNKQQEELKSEETLEITSATRKSLNEVCGLCQQLIGTDRWKLLKGHYVHKRCYKKQAREIFNGN